MTPLAEERMASIPEAALRQTVDRETYLRLLSKYEAVQAPPTANLARLRSRKALHRAMLQSVQGDVIRMDAHDPGPDGMADKRFIRSLLIHQKRERVMQAMRLLKTEGYDLLQNIAEGSEVDPAKIVPKLQRVHAGTPEAELFRFASFYWSVPVSLGYGRRVRFLVRDQQNGKLIGLMALADPVYNLKAREEWIGWTPAQKAKNLRNVMDAYVLGAVPPYGALLGGKLVASLVTSKEVVNAFETTYAGRRTLIQNRNSNAKLALITTTSGLGRSSIYDRIKLDGKLLYEPVGFTKGFGHFHVSQHTFAIMRKLLRVTHHPYAKGNRFGDGPSWRIRVMRAALEDADLESKVLLNHGVKREVFMVPLATNAREFLRGETKTLRRRLKTAREIGEACKARWIVPRAERDPTYKLFSRDDFVMGMLT